MAVPILTYTREATVNNTLDMLQKLETFANGLGWTSELQIDKIWTFVAPGDYQWLIGQYDFLELKSSGYGAQELVMRFLWETTGAGRGNLYCSLIDPNNPVYNPASSTSPESQDRVNSTASFRRMSLPDSSYTDGVYFFGNSRFIAVVCGLFTDAQASFAFGLPELLPEFQNELEISFFWPGHNYSSDSANYWWDNLRANFGFWKGFWGYVDTPTVYQWYQAKIGGGTSGGIVSNLYGNNATTPIGDFTNLKYVVRHNAFSDKRVAVQPTVFLKNSGTGQWYPCGVMPFAIVPYGGLSVGGTLTYGSDSYRVFPFTLQSHNHGFAFRTA